MIEYAGDENLPFKTKKHDIESYCTFWTQSLLRFPSLFPRISWSRWRHRLPKRRSAQMCPSHPSWIQNSSENGGQKRRGSHRDKAKRRKKPSRKSRWAVANVDVMMLMVLMDNLCAFHHDAWKKHWRVWALSNKNMMPGLFLFGFFPLSVAYCLPFIHEHQFFLWTRRLCWDFNHPYGGSSMHNGSITSQECSNCRKFCFKFALKKTSVSCYFTNQTPLTLSMQIWWVFGPSPVMIRNLLSRWWFQRFFIFTPKIGEDSQFD